MNINIEALISAVRKIAGEFPDVIYNVNHPELPQLTCAYTAGKCGPGEGCLIGQAAKISNPELYEEMRRYDNKPRSITIGGLLGLKDINSRWLSKVQSGQDIHIPWGECVKRADDIYRLESN